MSANTEISSGNRDASTTDAHVAALIESTDVRLENANGENDASNPENNIMTGQRTFLGCKSLDAGSCSPQSTRLG
jgi:hypothetical protein